MKINPYKKSIHDLFAKADITINGDRSHDIRVYNENFYKRIFRDGQLGIGESYMDGWWECDAIDEMVEKFINADLLKETEKNIRFILNYLRVKLSDIGHPSKAYEVAEKHYDLGNKLFEAFLDKRMVYSCAYWEKATNLDEAQENKLDLVCRKLDLKPGMKVLEIGCGWGSWAKYASEKYGVEVTGVTVSKEQAAYAKKNCEGLPVDIQLKDYREITGKYDRVVSIAMFEAVGKKYFRTFMEVAERSLKDDGVFVLHSIMGRIALGPAQSTFLNKYIFPNGELATLAQLSKAAEGLFTEEAHHQLTGHYEKTLEAWYQNFIANWPQLSGEYDERFFRMWKFYLQLSKGIFRSRIIQLWQFVYTKRGIPKKSTSMADLDISKFESR